MFLLFHLISSIVGNSPSTYDELLEYNFLVSLLPKGVTGYELNKNIGEFRAYLKETCWFKIQGYEIKYKSTINSVIEKGRLKNLKDINVKILVVWLNIEFDDDEGKDIVLSGGYESHRLTIAGHFSAIEVNKGINGGGRMEWLERVSNDVYTLQHN